MEEMMMVMMKIRSSSTSCVPTHNTLCPSWKLYENPFFSSHPQALLMNKEQDDHTSSSADQNKQIHRLHLPISARKIAASFWDLTFIKPLMESELEMAKAQISELKAELEVERKERKKLESSNRRLSKELSGERRGREALERVCEELAREISSEKAEMSRMKKGIEEERKMLRVAEVIREERVQMKLAEAKILLEEKLSGLVIDRNKGDAAAEPSALSSAVKRSETKMIGNHESADEIGNVQTIMAIVPRKSSPEAENPHIRRGIKGFVEFPKVVRAIGCRSGKQLSSKLECQKAQLKILLKHKGTVRFNGLLAN